MAIDLDLLRSLPRRDVETKLRSSRGVRAYAFGGALLFDYAHAAGLMAEGPAANQYFVASSGDGFIVAVSMAEVAPGYSDKSVLLAYEQDGEPIRAGVRLVVPGDDLGGRSVFGLEQIEVRAVPSVALSRAPVATSLRLAGEIERPATLSAASLAGIPQVAVQPAPSKGHGEKMRPERRFTGASVWSLLEDAGLVFDPEINEHILRKIVVASDSDGYAVAIAAGEIEPRFLGAPFIVAVSDADGSLGDADGGLRLIAPFDNAGARHLKGVSILELRDA